MPYIAQIERNLLEAQPHLVNNVGQLNYLFTRTILEFQNGAMDRDALRERLEGILKDYQANMAHVSYQMINDVMGMIFCVSSELYRRIDDSTFAPQMTLFEIAKDFYTEVAAPYENEKAAENGDVFDVGK